MIDGATYLPGLRDDKGWTVGDMLGDEDGDEALEDIASEGGVARALPCWRISIPRDFAMR